MLKTHAQSLVRPSDDFGKAEFGHTLKLAGHGPGIPRAHLLERSEYFLRVSCYAQTKKTVKGKRDCFRLLAHFCDWQGHDFIGAETIALFLNHALDGHEHPEGKWGMGYQDGKRIERYFKPNRPRTAQLYYDYLKGLFSYLSASDGFIHPMTGIKRPSASRPEIMPPTDDEVEKILVAVQRTQFKERNLAIMFTFIGTGIRLDELCMLDHGDVDLIAGTIRVRFGKGRKQRTLIFGDGVAQAIMAYRNQQHYDSSMKNEPLFKSGLKRIEPNAVSQMITAACKRAGIGRKSAHKFRHYFATGNMLKNVPQAVIMRLMGHNDPKMVLSYQHYVEGMQRAGEKAFNPADKFQDVIPFAKPTRFKGGPTGRPKADLESYPCTCGMCERGKPKTTCPRGRVIYKRQKRQPFGNPG